MQLLLDVYGALDTQIDLEHVFPWGQVDQIAEDGELVRMLEQHRFDGLLLTDPETREWVNRVIAAGHAHG